MIPRGIFSAAPGAENSLLNILPDPGKTDPVPKRSVDGGPRMRENDFSKSLKREVDRRERPASQEHDRKQIRREERRPERTEDSSHGTRNEKPNAVLNRNAQGKPVHKSDNGKSEAVVGSPIDRNPDVDLTVQQQENPMVILAKMLEEWIIKFLDQMNEKIGNSNPGPGDSKGLTGNELGPRFAIETPIPTQAGKPGDLLAGITIPGDLDRLIDGLSDLTTGQKLPVTDPNLKPWIELFERKVEGKALPEQELDPKIAHSRFRGQIRVPDLLEQIIRSARKSNNPAPSVNVNVAKTNPAHAQAKEILSEKILNLRIDPLVIDKPVEMNTNQAPVSRIFIKLSELVSKAGQGILKEPVPVTTTKETVVTIPAPEPVVVVNQNPGQVLLKALEAAPRESLRVEQPSIIEEVERVVQNVGKENITTVRLRLHPPELGSLVIQFRRDDNGIRIEFLTPHAAVQKALSDGAPKMIEKLADAGVDIDSLDVFLGNPGNGGEKSFSPLDDPSKPPLVIEASDVDGVEGSKSTDENTGSIYGYISDSRVDILV